jgi:hypothetical protein
MCAIDFGRILVIGWCGGNLRERVRSILAGCAKWSKSWVPVARVLD